MVAEPSHISFVSGMRNRFSGRSDDPETRASELTDMVITIHRSRGPLLKGWGLGSTFRSSGYGGCRRSSTKLMGCQRRLMSAQRELTELPGFGPNTVLKHLG